MDHLADLSIEDRQQTLDHVEGKKPIQRLLADISHINGVTQTELATGTRLSEGRSIIGGNDSTLTNLKTWSRFHSFWRGSPIIARRRLYRFRHHYTID